MCTNNSHSGTRPLSFDIHAKSRGVGGAPLNSLPLPERKPLTSVFGTCEKQGVEGVRANYIRGSIPCR